MGVDQYGDYEQMAAEVRAAQQRMAEIRVTAESEDGLISATVGASGQLIELRLDPRIYRAPDSAGLAEAITDTVHEAAKGAQEEGFEILARYLPTDATPENADLRFDPLLTDLDREVSGGAPR
ncbi:YbaB/EbfC family nucleoid-associated protein [Amycolatopsis cynarae]|uniref:YbaB/EbfC family nucleoid-associated protein n=1 Tax=Amycolatopsis cynarae TaxID=2995223 RepID=A0ABY7B845_9PSEU|nr:YbaB/EbfC family nucleoid-associated protein [Amycolatopsis sp. HUAS 11-8]WAL67848.1 YbaB/EbfC family nucleoid-associated protein [Amycolatopsis sp. HUAS 11-8]